MTKEPLIEVWNLFRRFARTRYMGAYSTDAEGWSSAISVAMSAKRRTWRVRRLYDRRNKRYVVQLIIGNGLGLRD